MITGLYTGILGLMLVVLILRVAMRRLKYKVGLGDGGIGDLTQAMRVHGNFIETVPIMLIMMVLMEESLVSTWILHAFGSGIIATRLLHAYGITRSAGHSFGRKTGIMLSLLLLTVGSVILITKALGNIIT